jgi:hypothetical protein
MLYYYFDIIINNGFRNLLVFLNNR